MSNIFSNLFKTLGIYTFSNVLTSAIPFFLLPFLTTYLAPSDYAIVDLFQAAYQFAIAFIGLNTFSALSRFYFDYNKDKFKNYVGNSVLILVVSAIIILLLILVFDKQLESVLKIPHDWLWVIVVYAFGSNIIETQLSIWQVNYKAISYGVFRISRTFFDIMLSIGFIMLLKYNWEGRVLGQLISVVVFLGIALYVLIKDGNISFNIDFSKIKELLSYGVPLILHILGAVIITYSDRIFIANYIDLESAGIYSVGYQVGMIVYIIQNSFNQAWVPWFFEKLKGDKQTDKIQIVKFTYIYFVLILLFALVVAYLAPLIYSVFISDAYIKGLEIVVWITIGFAFNGMYKMVGNYIFFIKKTYLISIITIFTAVINLILNYYMVNNWGAVGVAQATAISFLLQFLIVWVVSSKVYKMPWAIKIW